MAEKARDEYSPAEADRRFKEAIRRALTTPHKPREAFEGKTPRAKMLKRAKSSRKS
ncbi:MAG: hypothetical protein KGJ66_05305 [Alphaproteobacteria bacterium]|nr:hypothetical protein [Alphaproteobacteria bacterium]